MPDVRVRLAADKGEPVPFGWPDINSHFGIIDMAGFPKDRFYWYRAWLRRYGPGEGTVHLIPRHWNWPADARVDVWAFSNGASVELFVNGQPYGRKNQTRYAHVEWPRVPFAAGALRTVAYNASGAVIATESVRTTGPAARLRASLMDGVGATGLALGCDDVALVQVEVLDASGQRVAWHHDKSVGGAGGNVNVTFQLEGGESHGVAYAGGGNGDPSCHVPDHSPTRPAYHGLVLGIVRASVLPGGQAGGGRSGNRTVHTAPPNHVTLHATSPGIVGDTVDIRVLAPSDARVVDAWWCQRGQQA